METNTKTIITIVLGAIGAAWGIVIKAFAEKYPVAAVVIMTVVTATLILGYIMGAPKDEENSSDLFPIPWLLAGVIFFGCLILGYWATGK